MIIENTTPGVVALVNEGQVARPFQRQPTSTVFAIGFAPWGPIGVRKVVTSYNDFKRKFGGFHTLGYLAELAKVFFDSYGGKTMIAVRAGGAAAAKATFTINNRVGSPAATFKFDAKYPSSTVDIAVTVADVAGDTTNVDVTVVSVALGITETYKAIDLRDADTRTAFNADSKLVDVSLAVAAVAGATGRPAAGTVSLADGDDDSASVVAADLAAYLTQFADENLGTGQVVIPGFYDDANTSALIAHCELYNRLALVEPELATAYDEVVDAFENHSGHMAVYYPWVELPKLDGSTGKKFYPPTIFAAGACAFVDRRQGTHKAPANVKAYGAVDVERNVDETSVINDNVRDYLNGKNINAIAPIAGEGIKIYGGRLYAEAGETRVQFVHERRVLNLIYYTAKQGYRWAVFAVVDGAGRLFRDLRSSGQNFLRSLWRDGALYGKTEAEAFLVVADETNNPPEELELGRVHVQLAVKLSPTAEQIFVNIDNVPLSQDLNILNGGGEN